MHLAEPVAVAGACDGDESAIDPWSIRSEGVHCPDRVDNLMLLEARLFEHDPFLCMFQQGSRFFSHYQDWVSFFFADSGTPSAARIRGGCHPLNSRLEQ
jgi:hypothetical protein